jgi:hypothetical protein
MRQMGLRTSAFWAAWLTYGVALSLASTGVLIASGYAAGFAFFTNSSPAATFALFFSFALGMLALAVLLSTLISTSRTAQTVGYSLVLMGFVTQFVITSAAAGVLDLLYASDGSSWVTGVRYVLQMYPPFNFSKLFYDIGTLAGRSYDRDAGKILQVCCPCVCFTWPCRVVAPAAAHAVLNVISPCTHPLIHPARPSHASPSPSGPRLLLGGHVCVAAAQLPRL